jgi:CelD/BcsL family acetyltransferase involved in cellulose biosynthesis
MLHADILRPDALDVRDLAAWREWTRATPAFASPLLGPAFARLVGGVRDDAAVAVFRRDGRPVGVLAHHRRPGGLARPIGAPWSDCHALLTPPGETLDWRAALRAAGLAAFRFTGLVDPHGVFQGAGHDHEDEAYVVALPAAQGGPAYWEQLRAGSPKRFKNIRRLEHKLDREEGPLELVVGDRSPDALDIVFRWKREQFRRSGLHDVLHPAWCREMMARLFTSQDAELTGLLVTLRARGRVIAGHYGARAGAIYHPWIAAYDPAFAAVSPGLVFLSMMVRKMPEAGLARYELSGGHAHYKTVFASGAEALSVGAAELRPPGAVRARPELLVRVRRRLDHIAAAEITLGGRLHGVAAALSDFKKRLPSAGALKPEEA